MPTTQILRRDRHDFPAKMRYFDGSIPSLTTVSFDIQDSRHVAVARCLVKQLCLHSADAPLRPSSQRTTRSQTMTCPTLWRLSQRRQYDARHLSALGRRIAIELRRLDLIHQCRTAHIPRIELQVHLRAAKSHQLYMAFHHLKNFSLATMA